MAQSAKPEADKAVDTTKEATSNVADLGRRTSDTAEDITREAVDKAENTYRGGLRDVQRTDGAQHEVERAIARRSAEGTAEYCQAHTDLLKEQTQHNLKTLTSLTEAVDWDQ